MFRRIWMAVTMTLVAASFAVCQESAVNGRWQGTLNGADGPFTMTYTFKAEGKILTGTEASPIVSCSISYDSIEKSRTLWRV